MITPPPYQVLIIDDNPEFVRSLKNLIIDVSGDKIASVDCIYNTYDGLLMIRDNSYHFVFMDINMPKINGIMATRFVNFEYNKPNMKIIAVSFHTEFRYILQMRRAGADTYLIKDEIDAEKILKVFGF